MGSGLDSGVDGAGGSVGVGLGVSTGGFFSSAGLEGALVGFSVSLGVSSFLETEAWEGVDCDFSSDWLGVLEEWPASDAVEIEGSLSGIAELDAVDSGLLSSGSEILGSDVEASALREDVSELFCVPQAQQVKLISSASSREIVRFILPPYCYKLK